MATVPQIIGAMRAAAPSGQQNLDRGALAELRRYTRALLRARPDAPQELRRYIGLCDRQIALPQAQLQSLLGGTTILVTGGTGCIGAALMAELSGCRPARLVSVSRGRTGGWPRQDGARYLTADIRDRAALLAVFDRVRPDVVFNVAAQRDPGLAELEVHRTISTAVTGLRNVIEAAEKFGVRCLVHASTGKALRPYSGDVYAASKRVAEWMLASHAGRSDMRIGAARFTHVVDNSIIYQRLLDWCQDGGVIRLHEPDIGFYVQSARESAQLMLCAGLSARPGALRMTALNDLGWPVSLLDVALGLLARTGSPAPIYFSGYGPGYEPKPFPGLYDPRTAGDVSPLLNAFEAAGCAAEYRDAVDVFPLEFAAGPADASLLAALEDGCTGDADPAYLRGALDALSWALLDATLRAVPRDLLLGAIRRTVPYAGELGPVYLRMLAAHERHAGVDRLAMV